MKLILFNFLFFLAKESKFLRKYIAKIITSSFFSTYEGVPKVPDIASREVTIMDSDFEYEDTDCIIFLRHDEAYYKPEKEHVFIRFELIADGIFCDKDGPQLVAKGSGDVGQNWFFIDTIKLLQTRNGQKIQGYGAIAIWLEENIRNP